MWNLKYGMDELTYKTETDSQTKRTVLWLPSGRGMGRDGWESGVIRCKLIYIEWIHNKHGELCSVF